MEYKNPFENPDEKLWDQKVKDYKIVERKEEPEQKPAESLEKKVELDPLMLHSYEKEVKELKDDNEDCMKGMVFGYGIALVLPICTYVISKASSASNVPISPFTDSLGSLLYYAFYYVLPGLGGMIGLVSTARAIINAKKIKGLEKKIKELKK